jgi:hypothetical protein
MARSPSLSIDEFIQSELERRMLEKEGLPPGTPHIQELQRTPNAYGIDPIEPGEGHIDSLIRRFGPQLEPDYGDEGLESDEMDESDDEFQIV